ncbi:hypothetical protein FA95DRAFT_1366873 [Auriscalpium vulgare]|uniref:Uncharacterized protein n=1 Tax=Auriscalpium vulgare TaxID=40419 RepID=A0ACB8R1D3_9AGAM|nr:hypothetical protein FA95DRAFT_1366873 [Auriscalpium vulgare]
MAKVPLDVQIMFVEWVYRLSQHDEIDYATLRVCALVCKAWTSTAQRLLLRCPFLVSSNEVTDRAVLLLRTLRDRPSLATHILTIQIDFGYIDETDLDNPQFTLLELCPGVQRIDVYSGFSQSERLWKPALGARLRSIGLRPVVLCAGGDEEAIPKTIEMWPSVRVLDFALWETELSDADIDPVHWPIRDLSSVEVMALYGSAIPLIPLDIDLPALRDMELGCLIWADDYLHRRLFGTDMLSRIHTLRISGPFPPSEIFEHIECLKNLVFNELPESDADILGFPKTLRRVGYLLKDNVLGRLERAKDAEPFVSALRTLPELQHVSATRVSSPSQLTMLNEVCRERGVEFEMFENAIHVWRPQDIHWI